MEDTSKNTDGGIGELNFEIVEKGKDDSDKEFASSVKNILILVKDFYGADCAAVYWFNKNKQSFKLMAASDDERVGQYKERFPLGNDYVSIVCLRKTEEIYNIETDKEKELLSHYKNGSNVKSLMVYPLLYEDEAVAVVLCESKTANFFGAPNLYSLKVFAESVTNYIRYFSLNEDYVFENRLLKILASGKIEDWDGAYDVIKSIFDRYLSYEKLYLVFATKSGLRLSKVFNPDDESADVIDEGEIGKESIVFKSAEEKKIIIKDFSSSGDKAFRFSDKDTYDTKYLFCSMPVISGNKCLGAVAFDFKKEPGNLNNVLTDVYKLIFPFFLYLISEDSKDDSLIQDKFPGVLSRDSFFTRVKAEINKCRLFNDNSLYCIYTSIDNFENIPVSESDEENAERLFFEFLKEKFSGYDMIYRMGNNKCAVISNVCSDEKVFLEIEKIRKALSAKIYKIEDKDINFSASFAIKRYNDINMPMDEYLSELDNLLSLAQNEGGNMVKI